ncbi:MAG: DNA/RNA nuclease SfsA [Oceanicaulis sp.]|uniref:DNA/RNA nuclease SfsA n=1 Tax=unclassified Oceanicaulis TaxID=2632123 RepID=UPI000C42F4BD|nr:MULTISPECIES: DNA/RNA nuclease SfsA [unclassified Oceanicaulis]MBC39064.1 DNA/RNA nuclease SfsA [Oceanicaulis sp.]MBG36835.1 DNA/RNA nuclease SfsA [Oceanicaulis sp.]HBU62332.1 DNA/RNA nuclease SfsA [Oceanicaulis sp.]|tara:strand:+ start:5594 stop:6295 length:702 start_codon:yes stop_codon:yes gene_type:complete
MRFPAPLHPGVLIKRYKRFLADVTLDTGDTVTAHCPNPGSMMGLKEPGSRCWLSHADDPRRKLKYTLEVLEADGALVGINTHRPNALAEEAIREGRIPSLSGYGSLRREVRYGVNSRIDLLLESEDRPACYVEVKNCHLMRTPGLAEFPDSVTTRGAKHLGELSEMVRQGHRAVQLFIVQRPDCEALSTAEDLDPDYAQALCDAAAAGVEVLAWACAVTLDGIEVIREIEVRL